ncbi:hypothetical protein [uncultured Pseudosulfitobacter sp.]|uniref:hypothetical protein n=1 Tax=uncultured Pseudosulfitobacter sp. TaxID=2854214 RepID=UPI0030DC98BB|tara:strand:+ start:16004 stop:16249 length:246 start_codon:yes stop_codon:yes gene_type:complete
MPHALFAHAARDLRLAEVPAETPGPGVQGRDPVALLPARPCGTCAQSERGPLIRRVPLAAFDHTLAGDRSQAMKVQLVFGA